MLERELCNNQTGVGTGIQDPESLHQSTHRHHPFPHSSRGGGQEHGGEVSQQPANPSQASQGEFDLDFDEDDEGLFLESQEVWTKADDSLFDVRKVLHGTSVNHQYTSKERSILCSYDSQDYFPPHSEVYLEWLTKQPTGREWDRWLLMGIIGFIVGITGFLLHQVIDLIATTKWNYAKNLLKFGSLEYGLAWLWVTGYSLLFLSVSTCLVVYFRPSAGGSGMPELIGFLNGTMIRHIFNLKTFAVKFISCALAVASGMPIGPEGPMIHMGSMVGAGISQLRSKTLGIQIPILSRFRNCEDRRNFITAGAAAGIASAFGAPVGGLLFAMEEVSSFWSMKLSWQVFFCSMMSAFTTDLFNSAFSGFRYTGEFGAFTTSKYILFQIDAGIDMNVLALLPSVLLGCVGGLLGSLFIFLNLKLLKLRRRIEAKVASLRALKLLRVLEPMIILFITCLLSVFVPAAFSCTNMICYIDPSTTDNSGGEVCRPYTTDTQQQHLVVPKPDVEHYVCPWTRTVFNNGSQLINGSYNEAATLFFGTGENAIQQLFSRNTHLEFSYGPLITFLLIYFLLACWASGTNISCGLVVPMLLIGGLYGRILGRLTVDVFGVKTGPTTDWMDPGAFALLGAVSFFAGVSRLTMSLAVIMVEITNDIQFLLLIMTTIMVAKWVGDMMTHSIYHSLLELKCIPFLDATPVYKEHGNTVDMEHYTLGDVMQRPVVTLAEVERLDTLVKVLRETDHGGFPVISQPDNGGKFVGLITRFELMTLLCKGLTKNLLSSTSTEDIQLQVDYAEFLQMRGHKLADPKLTQQLLEQTHLAAHGGISRLNLSRFVNRSALALPESFSLHRTYLVFRTLGLRHLTVVDRSNQVVGIITRKDLMGFNIDEKLRSKQRSN